MYSIIKIHENSLFVNKVHLNAKKYIFSVIILIKNKIDFLLKEK